jgi:hypothetical protein
MSKKRLRRRKEKNALLALLHDYNTNYCLHHDHDQEQCQKMLKYPMSAPVYMYSNFPTLCDALISNEKTPDSAQPC